MMLEKIKERFKFKTKSSSKNKVGDKLIITIVISVLLFLILLIVTDDLLLSLMSALCIFFSLHCVTDGLQLSKKAKKETRFEREKLSLYENFLLYSSLENDYTSGLKIATDQLNISELKDQLMTHIENGLSGGLPIERSNSVIDSQIIEQMSYTLTLEETDDITINRLEDLIKEREDELRSMRMNSFPLINIPLALYLLAFTLAFSLR